MMHRRRTESGQASIIMIGIMLGAIALGLVLLTVGRAYLLQARLQAAADIAAASLANPQGDDPVARATAVARRNGAQILKVEAVPEGTRITASAPLTSFAGIKVGGSASASALVPRSTAFGSNGASTTPVAGGSAYSGPLVAIDAAIVCPAVASDYKAMQRAASVSGIRLYATSGYRSYAEQAQLYAQLGPSLAAPPGTSLHHQATEIDISVGPAGSTTHRWLTSHASAYSFTQRYGWEPWHWGNVRGCEVS